VIGLGARRWRAPGRAGFPGPAVLVGVAIAVLTVSGCAGFPDRGPVVPARRIEASKTSLQFFAARPAPGDGAEAIVRGFLNAGLDFHQDHQVAREYLAPARTPWRPEESVVVVDGSSLRVDQLSPEPGQDDPPSGRAPSGPTRRPRNGDVAVVRVSATVVARVDESGVLSLPSPAGDADSGPAFTRDLRLVAGGGQWRITNPLNGLVLTRTGFQETYRSLPLYFPDPTDSWLVPDVRWFPVPDVEDIGPTATLVVSALLDGPAPWLGDAVTTGAPAGTNLTAVGSVQIDGSTARIDLSHQVLDAKPAQRLLLSTQLQATLEGLGQLSLGSISGVVLTANQAKLDVPAGTAPVRWAPPVVAAPVRAGHEDAASYGPSPPLCLTPKGIVGQLGRTQQNQASCLPRNDLVGLSGPSLTLATSDSGGRIFAALADGGSRVVATTSGQRAQTVLEGARLTAPSIDPRGWIWSSPAASSGSVLAGALGRGGRSVPASWLAGAQVLSLRVSPEGARALLVVRRGRITQAIVAGVERDRSGAPTRLSGRPLTVLPDLSSAVDAGWSDTQQVIVLGSRAAPQQQGTYAWRVLVGGEASLVLGQPVPDAAGLAVSAGDQLDVFVRVRDGQAAVVSSLGSWQPVAVRDVTLPS